MFQCVEKIFSPTDEIEMQPPVFGQYKLSISQKIRNIDIMGAGSGGATNQYSYLVFRKPQLPIKQATINEMYEGDFQVIKTVCQVDMYLEIIRRTFQARLVNPISRLFISYPMEPSGMSETFILLYFALLYIL